MKNIVKVVSNWIEIGLIIVCVGLPMLIISLPFILIIGLGDYWIDRFKLKRFIRRNNGKVFLCLSNGNRQQGFLKNNKESIEKLVETITYHNRNIMYDNFNMRNIVEKEKGFPQLVSLSSGKVIVTPMKEQYQALRIKNCTVQNFLIQLELEVNELNSYRL